MRNERNLLRRVGDEADTGFDVRLKALDSFVEEFLLIIVGIGQDIVGFLCTVGLYRRSAYRF